MKDSSFEDQVRDALRDREPEEPGPHLSPVTLTELLEGTLSEDDRTAAEAHLTECGACREWAVTAAGASERGAGSGTGAVVSHPAASRPRPRRKAGPKRWGWAAAAVLVLAASLWQWQEHWPRAPKPEAQVEAWVAQALQGELPDVVLFPDLDSTGAGAGDEARLRSGSLLDRPLQISPRWSRILGRRPTFVFATQGDNAEILLVDGTENLVATISTEGALDLVAGIATGHIPLPDSLEDLTPGGRYAWKVNSRIDGELVASPYVPFEVLTEEESAALARRLDIAGDDLFRRGAVFAAAGLLGEASRAFGRWPEGNLGLAGEESAELQDELLEELVRRQKLPEVLAQSDEDLLQLPEE